MRIGSRAAESDIILRRIILGAVERGVDGDNGCWFWDGNVDKSSNRNTTTVGSLEHDSMITNRESIAAKRRSKVQQSIQAGIPA